MRIKINATELKEILDKHFGGIDTHFDIELLEGNYALETRVGKERLRIMKELPNYQRVATRGIFKNMGVLLSVIDTDEIR